MREDSAEKCGTSNYWSSTENSETNARNVNFNNGNVNNNNKTNTNSVRCVRGRQPFVRVSIISGQQNNHKSLNSLMLRLHLTQAWTLVTKEMSIPDNAPLFRKLYAFMIVIQRSIHHMPREYRYTLGAEVSKICWKCLDLAVISSYTKKGKFEKISELSSEFDRLNLRALGEMKIISAGQFAHWQENYLFEIGKQIGGWSRWASRGGG